MKRHVADFYFDGDPFEEKDSSNSQMDEVETEDDVTIPDWNLITAFDRILACAKDKKGMVRGIINNSALSYLMKRLEMTQMQVLIISVLMDYGDSMSWGKLARFFGLTRLSMMTHTEELEDLVFNRRWILSQSSHSRDQTSEGFEIMPGVINAIRHDQIFVPENIEGLSEQVFIDKVVKLIHDHSHFGNNFNQDDEKWIMVLVKKNQQLPLCKTVMEINGDMHDKSLLFLVINDYAEFDGESDEGLDIDSLDSYYQDDFHLEQMKEELREGDHVLQEMGLIDFKCDDGLAEPTKLVLTSKTKNELLAGYKPRHTKRRGLHRSDRDLISYKEIAPKPLYYNESEQKQIDRLRLMLSKDQLTNIQQRLKDKGMRTGVAILMSGGPGTGKTETVKQIARETGRDLLMIDISQIKDMWVGGSEKNTKAIFERYKRLCKTAEVAPILMINECDAILGKRMEQTHDAVDKMENSCQNILLQGIEDLEGIMICTTNLACSLDDAFERRFLCKINFGKPQVDVRAKIWQSMMPTLSDNDAHALAERYDFSGGQCENVTRKASIEYVLNGNEADISLLDTFCKEELALRNNKRRPIVGFCA